MADVTFGDTVVDWLIISAGVLIAVVLPLLTAAVKANFGVATAATSPRAAALVHRAIPQQLPPATAVP